ncbi:MAG TPA: helix-turn-helix domain-containing protein [Bacillota bacterium]|nr:helix-turn-helix domain-containing protein [Bacillota bacterium]
MSATLFLNGLILQCSRHIQDARSISAIFYILRGKRSIQTVHDARMFHLENYYGTYQSLNRKLFNQRVHQLSHEGLLQKISHSEDLFTLSKRGQTWLENIVNKRIFPFDYFNGFNNHQLAATFFARLRLFIQTYTNSRMNHLTFIPIIDDAHITSWVKSFYVRNNHEDAFILQLLYRDLANILGHLDQREAEFFIDQFSGYKQYGLSTSQLAVKYDLSREDVILLSVAITHKIIQFIQQFQEQLKLLPVFIRDISKNQFITKSAQTTYNLFKRGYDIQQIAHIRQLKENTICDHFVEISLFDTSFPVEDYVDEEAQREIVRASQKLQTPQLKEIKQVVSEHITYFQIRLVLAQLNMTQGEDHG